MCAKQILQKLTERESCRRHSNFRKSVSNWRSFAYEDWLGRSRGPEGTGHMVRDYQYIFCGVDVLNVGGSLFPGFQHRPGTLRQPCKNP